jgi:hypothetical protein
LLEANPGLPVNHWVDITYNADGETDQEQRDEIDRVATILGYPPHTEADGDHYLVEAEFGPVKYRAVAITAAHMAAYCAASTYHGAVTP